MDAPPGGKPRNPLDLPCKIAGIKIRGNERTRRDVIMRELQGALAAKTHSELAKELSSANSRMRALDAFHTTVCDVDAGEGLHDVKVTVRVEEKGRHTLGTTAQVTGGEGWLDMSWVFRNFVGRCEQIRGTVSVGHLGSNQIKLEGIQPNAVGNVRAHMKLFHQAANHTSTSSYKESQKGFSFTASQPDSPSSLTYELCTRNVVGGTKVSADEVEQSTKSSIRHTYMHDSRDDSKVPTRGAYVRNMYEVAGFFGGETFWREQLDMQMHRSVGDYTLSLAGSIGVLQALGYNKSCVCDKLFMGGLGAGAFTGGFPLRGFSARGVGPREGDATATSSAVGGDVCFSLSGAFLFPLPGPFRDLSKSSGARMQVFCSVGNNVAVEHGTSALCSLPSAFAGYRSAVGVGLVVPTPLGRLELNVSQPTRTDERAGDLTAGLQMGFWEE